jgi:surface carbohydrate biosynthesis protein (TIGR04326 family)
VTASVLVWDQKGEPPCVPERVLCWQSYAHGNSVCSVPRHLEAHAERIRSKYLAFIHELGESLIAGKRVVDHLDLGGGFSLWWMTTIAEKSPLKSPRIYDCLRMFALEEMVAERRPSNLTLVSSDRSLAQALQAMCRKLGIGFSWQRRDSRQKWSLRRAYLALPYALKALVSLRHVVMRWPLRALRNPHWQAGERATFICSYFIHLDPNLCAQGQFHSRQWGNLPKLLQESGRRTNWLQLFLFSEAVPNVETGLSWTSQFNADSRNQGCHSFLDSYLTFTLVLKALKYWLWLCAVSWRLRDIPPAFCPNGSALWLWPLLRDDWCVSLHGQIGMGNCLAIEQFDAALADVPRQEFGLYLLENQAWEKALLRAWRKHGHGRIIGVQHSTAPFWHLYYFHDPRSLRAQTKSPLPLPDRLAVNGAVVWNAFLVSGYPENLLAQVEALRYLNLSGVATPRAARTTSHDAMTARVSGSPRLKILVLGDMIPSSMDHLLRLLEGALGVFPDAYALTFKFHPGLAIDLTDHPALKAQQTTESLERILASHDVAVSANSTSAAVDAYVAGLPVIISLDGDDLNLSPLRGQSGVRFVSSSQDLADALRAARGDAAVADSDRNEFFLLDPELTRWKRLLAEAVGT